MTPNSRNTREQNAADVRQKQTAANARSGHTGSRHHHLTTNPISTSRLGVTNDAWLHRVIPADGHRGQSPPIDYYRTTATGARPSSLCLRPVMGLVVVLPRANQLPDSDTVTEQG